MKKLLTSIVILFSGSFTYGQELQSQVKSHTTVNGYSITDYYYNLEQKFGVPSKTERVDKKLVLDEIIHTALTMKSDSFVVSKNEQPMYTVVLHGTAQKSMTIRDLKSDRVKTVSLDVPGDITANRAIEILNRRYQSKKSRIENGVLYFNNNTYRVIENHTIQEQIIAAL